jgi:hypothetical protein
MRALHITYILGLILFILWSESCKELHYRFSGKSAVARVVEIQEKRTGRYKSSIGHVVAYSYLNANTGQEATGGFGVKPEEMYLFPIGRKIPIEYYGDQKAVSRVAETGSLIPPILLLGSLLLMVFLVIRFFKSVPPPRARR